MRRGIVGIIVVVGVIDPLVIEVEPPVGQPVIEYDDVDRVTGGVIGIGVII